VSYSQNFADLVLGLMEGFGKITIKKMFGEAGLYSGPTLFAMIADDILYFKAKDALAAELKALGSSPFTYHGKSDKQVAMPYWQAPESCLDDPDEMKAWCKKIIAGATASAAPAKKAKKKA